MDPKSLLDYAVFQLTPTRTRCDLVVFSGKKTEKLASGLVEPFLCQLKYAEDQIRKGGYSITLRPPPSSDNDDEGSYWFTKATFQRFVRFVSTPEILERIVRIEQELLQIESSIQSSTEIPNLEDSGHPGEGSLSGADGTVKKSTNSSKLPPDEEDHGTEPRENSRIRLQRVMDTRKALLQKEQAMAYARAVVAGYEMDTIDDLISFADAFGASRLRVACVDFKELYNKKHADDQWMDELAAVQACPVPDLSFMGASGIMMAGENIGMPMNPLVRTSSESQSESAPTSTNSDGSKENNLPNAQQQQIPWMNQIPQYMYNFQGPMQQMPPYQGYPFPMQPYFQGPVRWTPPGDVVQSKNHRSSRKKEKSSDAASEEDEQSSNSDVGTDSSEEEEFDKKSTSRGHKGKKNKKKSSKTVVIRNINYITSQRRNGEEDEGSEDSSGGDPLHDGASIKEGIDNAIASLEKRSKGRNKSRGKHALNGLNGGDDEPDLSDKMDVNVSEVGKGSTAWDAFQNLLMSHNEPNSNDVVKHGEDFVMGNSNGLDLEGERVRVKSLTVDDSVLAIQRGGGNGGNDPMVDFANGETNMGMKKIVSEGENALFSNQFNGSSKNGCGTLPDFSSEFTTVKTPQGEDWFVVNSSGGMSEAYNTKHLEFANNGSYTKEMATKETPVVVDDSFIIEARPIATETYTSPWKTDINIDADMEMPSHQGNGSPTVAKSGSAVQPDDLSMILVRESRESAASWTPEMDYQAEISFNETDKNTPKANGHAVEDPSAKGKNAASKKTASPGAKYLSRDAARSRLYGTASPAKSKKPSSASRLSGPRIKFEKEEEERKRMEEMRLERQRRIAERTAATGGLASPGLKKVPEGSKSAPSKLERNKSSTVRRI